MSKPRFIIVVFPAQGHINPALQLAKRLILIGCEVTFVTTVLAHRRMVTKGRNEKNDNFTPPNDMSFAPFSDGYDDGFGGLKQADFTVYAAELRRRGSEAIKDLVRSGRDGGRPYTCLVYTLVMHWAADVAVEVQIPVVLFWVQPAIVFDICHYYFHGYGDLIRDKMVKDRSSCLTFPGLPFHLTARDLPSYLDASDSTLGTLINFFREQFDVIEKESQPKILVNTFDALEPEALKAVCNKYVNLIGIGPLIDPVDLRNPEEHHMISEWLNSKPKGSVIYVSFGSVAVLSKPQMEEIAKGLLCFGRPFLWVIRENDINKAEGEGEGEEKDKVDSFGGELEKIGMIVPWCCQVEVLCNKALGCFVTHCGWNSTLESLVCGVPVVACPQSLDQFTNAKLIEDVWKNGVKVKANEEGIVEGEEIKRCLELVMRGDQEMRENAEKWKDLAREASKDGGSSDRNLKAFVNEVIGEKTFL